jgi:hypothetical protein
MRIRTLVAPNRTTRGDRRSRNLPDLSLHGLTAVMHEAH